MVVDKAFFICQIGSGDDLTITTLAYRLGRQKAAIKKVIVVQLNTRSIFVGNCLVFYSIPFAVQESNKQSSIKKSVAIGLFFVFKS